MSDLFRICWNISIISFEKSRKRRFGIREPTLDLVIHDVDKIFEAYYRERKKTDGFGLGLSLVKSICDEEGVDIRIDSTIEYTRFDYQFPKGGDV